MPSGGRLRERVRFDRRAEYDDGAGNMQAGWSTLGEVPAEIKPVRGGEALLAGKLAGKVPAEITVRWSRALGAGDLRLTTDDRAVDARTGDAYQIRAIENRDMRRQWLTLTCEAGVA